MSVSDRQGDCLYSASGEPMFTGCRGSSWPRPMPPCAYCQAESTRTCDAPGGRYRGRCGVRMCTKHTTRVGDHHDLCREHAAAGDHAELIRRAETATNVWWETVETNAMPIAGTGRPLSEADRIPGVIDPDDELA